MTGIVASDSLHLVLQSAYKCRFVPFLLGGYLVQSGITFKSYGHSKESFFLNQREKNGGGRS